jgi:hypothetical protein
MKAGGKEEGERRREMNPPGKKETHFKTFRKFKFIGFFFTRIFWEYRRGHLRHQKLERLATHGVCKMGANGGTEEIPNCNFF